jgi:hypothetical protein
MRPELIRRDESLPAFANASCNTHINSGFRITGKCEKLTARTLTIKAGSIERNPYCRDGSFPPGLAGKTLVLYPTRRTRTWWRIKSSTSTAVTIENGDMVAYVPPVSSWHIQCFRAKNKRKPTTEEVRAIAEAKKKAFLVCDGEPRGTWNGYFAWSSRNQDFAPDRTEDDIVDRAREYAICIRLAKNRCYGEWKEDTATVDVTPRRVRMFRPKPGTGITWENISYADPENPERIAAGHVTADGHGLVTVPEFLVGKKGWGNRLVLTAKEP